MNVAFPWGSLRAFALALLFVANTLCSNSVQAQELETSELVYHVQAERAACPDEGSFRNLVAARLGYDPFGAGGKHHTRVELSERGDKLRGRAEVMRRGSKTPGVRELTVGTNECVGLTTALATAVAIALDPVREQQVAAAREAPAPAPAPAPVPATIPPAPVSRVEATPAPTPAPAIPAPPVVSPQPTQSPEKSRVRVRPFLRGAGTVALAVTPGVSIGGEFAIGLRYRFLSFEALGRVESTPGAKRVMSGDRLEATVISGGLLACAEHRTGLMGCLGGRIGTIQGRAPDVVEPILESSLYGALNARGAYVLKLSRVISAQAFVEGTAQLVRTSLSIDGRAVWIAPGLAGSAGAGMIFNF